jgi:hypothetical protein
MYVEAFIPECAVEALDVCILLRLIQIDKL